jgi:hypothetical protein
MNIVLNFISDFLHAYWFCILWGAVFGWIAYSIEESEKEKREKILSKINSAKKTFSFAKNILKNRNNAPDEE